MKLSKRILSVAPSATVALNTKAKALTDAGTPVMSFAVGEPDFATPKAITEVAIKSLQAGRTKYGAPGGGIPLRKAIQKKLKRDNDLDFEVHDIVAGVGSKEILFHTFLALINDGDEILIPAPYWVSYADQIKAAGGVPVILPLQKDPAGNLDPKFIEKYVTAKTTGVVLNFPNNPSGFVPSDEVMKKLGEFILEKKYWVISDEIYEYLSFDKPHASLLKLVPQLKPNYILINGLSKGFAMTGWRIGYGAGPKEVMTMVRNLQSHSSTSLPPFIEDAAQFALEQGRPLVTDLIEQMKQRRNLAVQLLKEFNIPCLPPNGAFYVYLDLRSEIEQSSQFKSTSTMGFSEWLLEKYHIAAVPGEAFGTPGFLRLSYAVDENMLKKGIGLLAEALKVIS